MTLHTTMPLELVLQGWNEEDKPKPTEEVWVKGVKMQIIPVAPGMGKVVRLIECKLDDYLNPDFTPGMMVYYESTGRSR